MDSKKRLSPSRLNNFLNCTHYAALWLDGVAAPEETNASLDLVQAKGFEHEAHVLKLLETQYGAAASIATSSSLERRVSETLQAISVGAPLIYQGAVANDRWIGFPDFLIRTEKIGDAWCYEPEDAKLARTAKAEHVLQLGVYAALLAEATASPIANGRIHVGLGEPARFDLARTRSITKRLMKKFETFSTLEDRRTKAVRSSACDQCAFHSRCDAEWREADSPVFVAGIRGDQIIKLETEGVTTLTQLAAIEPTRTIAGIGKESVSKLVQQARLQKKGANSGEGLVEILPVEAGRGFTSLPAPQVGDLFFDMEGDPLYPEGLEYLFGIWGPLGAEAQNCFHPIWAHDRAAEKIAFEESIRLFTAHLERFPQAHIYHYAQYEPAALKRLAMRHATMEAELDRLLRAKCFVDLFQVVRQAIRASTEGYSLKDLEKIYWGKRTGDVTNAGDSIVEYERWRETGEQSILDGIAHYNEDDCVSTARMRDWLESLRPVGADFGLAGKEDDLDAKAAERAENRAAREAERQLLATAVREMTLLTEPARNLVAELLWFHQRSQKPQWWALFDRQTWSDSDLAEDLDSLGGLALDPSAPVYRDKQSLVATYRFEPQETKLKSGDACKIALTLENAGTIVDLDTDIGKVVVRRGVKSGNWPDNCSLIPGRLIDQDVLVDAVAAFARRVATGDTANDLALISLIGRQSPRLKGHDSGKPIVPDGMDILHAATDATVRLDSSYLVIQGPPGTGKTFTTSHVISHLLKAGKRIAVSSNSHNVINNLLAAVEERAIESGFTFVGAKKASKASSDSAFSGRFVTSVYKSEDVNDEHQLVGGTAFHFALPEELGRYDYLFIDEAGQVSLGNLVATGGCARNIVLVGDQMQLPQPVQGVHPGDSGLSCLDYLMRDQATVPPELGILLNTSWRMHPALCSFVSDAFYEGKLASHPTAAERHLILHDGAHSALQAVGLTVMEVDHKGCTQNSVEEASAVTVLAQSLLLQSLRDKTGKVRKFELSDVLVVAPFNAQVNLLLRHLPTGTRVGTVDKFQGQEAAVVIVSMATSNGADAPRGSEFLFSINRLNVAISRAQCLAVLIRSKNLLEMSPATIPDLWRLEGFARADEKTAII